MSQGKETIVEYLTSIPAWYLATVEETPEGAKPHVRPFSFARMQDGDIQFCTATTKDCYREMRANPFVELTAWKPGHGWIILRGRADLDDRAGEAVREAVRVGDVITFGVGFETFGEGMAVSRAFDDKCGVWVACRVMEKLAEAGRAAGDFIAVATTQEEIGTRGAMTSAHAVNPDVALAFDVTHATDYPGIDKTKYGKIVCGAGPVIARGPNINPVVFERLVAAAEAEGIPYQLEAEPSVTGTDARAIQVTRAGIPTGLVSVPLRYMHTPTEVVALADLEATVRLLTRFALDLDADACFVPGLADPVRPGIPATLADVEE